MHEFRDIVDARQDKAQNFGTVLAILGLLATMHFLSTKSAQVHLDLCKIGIASVLAVLHFIIKDDVTAFTVDILIKMFHLLATAVVKLAKTVQEL